MTAPEKEPHLRRLKLRALPFRTKWPIALFVAASMVAFTPTNVVAKAPDTQGDVQASAKIDEEASGLSKDYRLAPGDRLTIVVYDQPQLSGQFIVDGGGGILLPLAGAVSLSGLTLAEAQKRIQDQFADGVLVQPAVSVRITDYRPIFVTGNVRKPGELSLHHRSIRQGRSRGRWWRRGAHRVQFQQRHVGLHHRRAARTPARRRTHVSAHAQGAPCRATRRIPRFCHADACWHDAS